MASTEVGCKDFDSAAAGEGDGNTPPNGENTEGSGSGLGLPELDQLNLDISDTGKDSSEGEWEVIDKMSKNRAGSSAPWWSSTPDPDPDPAPPVLSSAPASVFTPAPDLSCAPVPAPAPALRHDPAPPPNHDPALVLTRAPSPAPNHDPVPAPLLTPTPAPSPVPTPNHDPAPAPVLTRAPAPTPNHDPTAPALTRAPTCNHDPAPALVLTCSPAPALTRAPTPSHDPTPIHVLTRAPTPALIHAPTLSHAPAPVITRAPTPSHDPALSHAPAPVITRAPTPSHDPAPAPAPVITHAPAPSHDPAPAHVLTPAPTLSRAHAPVIAHAPASAHAHVITRAPAPSHDPAPTLALSHAPAPVITRAPAPSHNPAPAPVLTPAPILSHAHAPVITRAPAPTHVITRASAPVLNHALSPAPVPSHVPAPAIIRAPAPAPIRAPAPAPRAWGQSDGSSRQGYGLNVGYGKFGGYNLPQANDSRRPVGRGITKLQPLVRGWQTGYVRPPPVIPPPLKNGWQWAGRGGSSGSQSKTEEENNSKDYPRGQSMYDSDSDAESEESGDVSDEDHLLQDSDDDLSDDYDSDASKKSHETRKKHKWFKSFFEALDQLTVDQLIEVSRQWHCPACTNGPGAIDWYNGLQPLIAHARTKGATRVKIHRELAVLLDAELVRRGTSALPAGEVYGKWKGLRDITTDHQIVWPPMVVVLNTSLEKDENDRWTGMGNQELLEYFSTYDAKKARHSYGPQGHRGRSLLLFEGTAMGYLEAERLHKHFIDEGRDKESWEKRKVLFGPGGKRRLYGYLAGKEDIDLFNQHSHGKQRLKFEMKSYQEMVVIPMKQMSEDNQQLIWLRNKVTKQEQRSKTLEESFGAVAQKLRETMEENRIVRLRTKTQQEENKEQMHYLEKFYKEQTANVHKSVEEKEKVFEKLLQEERMKAQQFQLKSLTNDDFNLRKEEAGRFIASQAKEVEEFEAEREKLIYTHEENKVELRRKFLADEVELEKKFDAALTKLMEKHAPAAFQASSSSSRN